MTEDFIRRLLLVGRRIPGRADAGFLGVVPRELVSDAGKAIRFRLMARIFSSMSAFRCSRIK
jgi:hypothetical protein